MSTDVEHMPYAEVMMRVGELYDELQSHPDPAVGKKVEEMLDWVDAFHREGLGRLVEMIRSWRGEIFLESVGRDDVTGTFLAMYDLGELPATDTTAADAVAEALEEIRPYVESHGGTITVDSIVDGVVKVRMLGSCDGCPSSAATLTVGVEQALREHWPNFRRLEVIDPDEEDGAEAGSGAPADAGEAQPVQLLQIGRKEK
jgi:Fe-S cluster biogenesis protein NfuA